MSGFCGSPARALHSRIDCFVSRQCWGEIASAVAENAAGGIAALVRRAGPEARSDRVGP